MLEFFFLELCNALRGCKERSLGISIMRGFIESLMSILELYLHFLLCVMLGCLDAFTTCCMNIRADRDPLK